MNYDLSNKPISKRALELEDVTSKIREIWRNNEGPLANIFRIMSYMIPFVPGLGWGIFVLERGASFFGWGMGDLGGALDRAIGLRPGRHLRVSNKDIEIGLYEVFGQKSASLNEDELIKVALAGGLFRLIGGIPRLAGLIFKAIKFLLLAFGITKIGDMYAEATGITEPPGEILLDEMGKKEETKPYSPADIAGLMSLIKDPARILDPMKSFNPMSVPTG